jgi:hypothetical protein
MQFSLLPASNRTFSRDRHPEKQPCERISTENGIQIDLKNEHLENASRSIVCRLQFDSNDAAIRDLQSKKHILPRISINGGIEIESSE